MYHERLSTWYTRLPWSDGASIPAVPRVPLNREKMYTRRGDMCTYCVALSRSMRKGRDSQSISGRSLLTCPLATSITRMRTCTHREGAQNVVHVVRREKVLSDQGKRRTTRALRRGTACRAASAGGRLRPGGNRDRGCTTTRGTRSWYTVAASSPPPGPRLAWGSDEPRGLPFDRPVAASL